MQSITFTAMRIAVVTCKVKPPSADMLSGDNDPSLQMDVQMDGGGGGGGGGPSSGGNGGGPGMGSSQPPSQKMSIEFALLSYSP